MKLIVNGDDYGYTWGTTQGILYGNRHGIITSTTVLTNSPDLESAAEAAKENPSLGFGVHLTLTLRKPLTNGKTICDKYGNFYKRKELDLSQMDPEEIENEFRAQIERFIEIFKKKPDHLDSHHSIHDRPETIEITKKLMKEYELPARRLSNFKFVTGFYAETATVSSFIKLLEENRNEVAIEIMSHLGFCDSELEKISSYNTGRLNELMVLCNPVLIQYIKEHNIELATYNDNL